MKIRYIDEDGPEHTSTQGYAFKRGEWVDVTEAFAIMKLSRNPGFEAMKDGDVQVSSPAIAPKKRGRPKIR